MSDGNDEDSDQNEESEDEVAAAAHAWSAPVRDYISCGCPFFFFN
jgi:hypothetical protein